MVEWGIVNRVFGDLRCGSVADDNKDKSVVFRILPPCSGTVLKVIQDIYFSNNRKFDQTVSALLPSSKACRVLRFTATNSKFPIPNLLR